MIRFHGVFAPNARLRAEVVPTKEPRKLAEESASTLGDAEQEGIFGDEPERPKRNPWAWLLKKVFLADVTECPDCGGRMKWLEVCTQRRDIHRVLAAEWACTTGSPSTRLVSSGAVALFVLRKR